MVDMENREKDATQPSLIDLPPFAASEVPPNPRKAARQPRGSRKTVTPSEGIEDAGAALERRVGRLEFAEGALVRLRAPVRAAGGGPGRDVLTDLDVVALDIDSRLRVSRSIIECKLGQGQSKEPDRLFWLAGLKEYVRSPRAVLVRQTVTARGRAMARRLAIEILDVPQIESLEKSVAWLPEKFAHVGDPRAEAAEKLTDQQLRAIALPSELIAYLRGDSLFAGSTQIMVILSDLGTALDDVPSLPHPADVVLAGHSLIALLCAAIADARTLDSSSRAELESRLERTSTVGNASDGGLLEVLGHADAIMGHAVEKLHEAYESTGVVRQGFTLPKLREIVSEPPTWIPRYVDFVEALRANRTVARELLQTAELVSFDALLGGEAHTYAAFDHLFTVEHRQLLRLAILTLDGIVGETLTSGFRDFDSVRFDRSRPHLPDRRSAPTKSATTESIA